MTEKKTNIAFIALKLNVHTHDAETILSNPV